MKMFSAGGHVATDTLAPASASDFAIANPKPASSATPATRARLPARSIVSIRLISPVAALLTRGKGFAFRKANESLQTLWLETFLVAQVTFRCAANSPARGQRAGAGSGYDQQEVHPFCRKGRAPARCVCGGGGVGGANRPPGGEQTTKPAYPGKSIPKKRRNRFQGTRRSGIFVDRGGAVS